MLAPGRHICQPCATALAEQTRCHSSHRKRGRSEESASRPSSPPPRATQRARRADVDGAVAMLSAAAAAAAATVTRPPTPPRTTASAASFPTEATLSAAPRADAHVVAASSSPVAPATTYASHQTHSEDRCSGCRRYRMRSDPSLWCSLSRTASDRLLHGSSHCTCSTLLAASASVASPSCHLWRSICTGIHRTDG